MRAFTVKQSDIERCPIKSLMAVHYRADGSCRCPVGYVERPTLAEQDPSYRAAMIDAGRGHLLP